MLFCHPQHSNPLYSFTPPQQLRLDDSKLLPAFTPEALLPEGVTSLVQQVLTWPGMSALLGWVSGGHFLGGLGPDDLGRALLDVQVGAWGRGGGALSVSKCLGEMGVVRGQQDGWVQVRTIDSCEDTWCDSTLCITCVHHLLWHHPACCCDVQAPHIHFLLLEAADILRLHPLPRVQVVQASAPFVRLLRIPVGSSSNSAPAGAKGSGSSSTGSNGSRAPAAGAAGSSGVVQRCQRASLVVLSSAAMQLLQPAELQAAMSCALAPLALEGGSLRRIALLTWCIQCFGQRALLRGEGGEGGGAGFLENNVARHLFQARPCGSHEGASTCCTVPIMGRLQCIAFTTCVQHGGMQRACIERSAAVENKASNGPALL